MSEQTANLCTTDAAESLREIVAERDREIERLKEGQSILILARDEQKRLANEYRDLWSRAAVKAQPSGVVLPEPLKAAIMRADDVLHALAGWESQSVKLEQRHGAGWLKEIDAIRRELHTQLARLNSSPVSAGDECECCDPDGVYAIDGSGPFDCPDCGKKAAAQTAVKTAESRPPSQRLVMVSRCGMAKTGACSLAT